MGAGATADLPSGGGGAYAGASATVTRSSIRGNSVQGAGADGGQASDAEGGGIFAHTSLMLVASTISGNSATGGNAETYTGSPYSGGAGEGGGAWCGTGTLTVIDSTVASNIAAGGGGDYSAGGNGDGGGIAAGGKVFIYDSTVVYNVVTAGTGTPGGTASGGGLWDSARGAQIFNTIISDNKAFHAYNDIAGTLSSVSGYNLIGIGGGLTNGHNGNKLGIDKPLLSPLGNNGGPTQTLVPLSGSPAINAGSNALIPAGVTTDQRGLKRIVGNIVDIGADESGA
jgi:hypothetical protein